MAHLFLPRPLAPAATHGLPPQVTILHGLRRRALPPGLLGPGIYSRTRGAYLKGERAWPDARDSSSTIASWTAATTCCEAQRRLRVQLPRAHQHLGQPITTASDDYHPETLSLASLAASSFAATQQLASILDENEFTLLFHEGKSLNLHVSQVTDQVLLIVTFGRETQVGKVRLYTQRAIEVLRPIFEGSDEENEALSVDADFESHRRQCHRRPLQGPQATHMPLINFAAREINYKIVYYGCGLCGKTTNSSSSTARSTPSARGKLVSIATEEERTLYFDFLPLSLGTVKGMQTRFHLYTVPGQSYYNASRKLVLQGVDGVIFVADSQITRLDENVESYLNLWDNLSAQGDDLSKLGFVIQMNKRDLGEVFSVEDLNELLNHTGSPVIESSAITGHGVFETLSNICKQVIAKTG